MSEDTVTTLPGLYYGNSVSFAGSPALDHTGSLKIFGITFSVGWDIPTLWAIDHDNQCWANGAYGGALQRIPVCSLLNELANDENEQAKVRVLLGMKPAAPNWMKAARAANWVPPAGFNEDSYEW